MSRLTPINKLERAEPLYFNMPSFTYAVDFAGNRACGYCDGKEAIKQAIFKHLQTKRYGFKIYDGQYGTEIFNLVGKNFEYAKSEAKRYIRECLSVDERITDVYDFQIEKMGDNMEISFICETIFGDIGIKSTNGISFFSVEVNKIG